MKQVSFVAHDAAPSRCFRMLAPVLEQMPLQVRLFIANGSVFNHTSCEVQTTIERSHVLVLGMSSSPEFAKIEIEAGHIAKRAGIPIVFYGDTPGCSVRAGSTGWFNDLATSTRMYLSATEQDAEDAKRVFPHAFCIATGNPLRELMAFPKHSREAIRNKLCVSEEEKLIFAPGSKFAAGNMASWMLIAQALHELRDEHRFKLVLTLHPSVPVTNILSRCTLLLYNEFVEQSPVPTEIVFQHVLSSSAIVPAADLVIQFSGSVGLEASYQRIPVITLGFEPLHELLRIELGKRMPETVEDGVSKYVAGNLEQLTDAIRELLNKKSELAVALRANQEKHCVVTAKPGLATQRIAHAIKKFLV